VLAGIAAISFVLRQAAINNIKAGRRKKRFVFEKNEIDNFLEGKLVFSMFQLGLFHLLRNLGLLSVGIFEMPRFK